MNPREFYALAIELLNANSPAKTRTAISRAYYAAFHVGAEVLRELGFSVSKGGAAHGEVARCFANAQDSKIGEAASSLADLHTSRLRADYQLQRRDVEQIIPARRMLETALEVIEAFDRIPGSPHRATIQSAIAAWRKSNGYP